MEAYVLIQTRVGKAVEVAQELRRIEGVVSAEAVAGPYDVIARAEAVSVDALGKLVVSRIQLIDGVTRTLTCPIVHL
jgi:DNA-binding Lrp family transcriptional regulator